MNARNYTDFERNVDEQANGQKSNRQNYPNLESNLAMMVIYLPVKFEFNWPKHFRVKSEIENVDGQTDRRLTHQSNRRVGYTQPT